MSARVAAVALALGLLAAPAEASGPVPTSFPADFPVIVDHSLREPVLGFGARGPVRRTPVIFLHGNNDTSHPTTCNGAFGRIHAFAQYFHDHGYALSELWGLSYQGEQCDLLTSPPNRSGPAHSTVENVPDLRAFVDAVMRYTGASQVDVVGHSLGGTLTREWLRQDGAYARVRTVVAVDSPHHGIINCSPNPRNFWAAPAAGGFNPDSAICREYGAADTPLLAALNAGDETPGPTAWLSLRNADTSFVYFEEQDGSVPPVPAEDREGRPHDFSGSAALAGATNVELVGQGRHDGSLGTTHLGIVNSPEAWRIAFRALEDPGRAVAPAPSGSPPRPSPPAASAASPIVRVPPALAVRVVPRRDRRAPFRFATRGRVVPPRGVACGGGVVAVQVKQRGQTISTRRVRVRPDCSFAASVTFARAGAASVHRGPLAFHARFGGDDVLTPAAAVRRGRAG
ncbi:MAG TPA: alpha/beta fold hydrolase [Solirubrobacteraceae bacterium]|nr:alpha/beta fold hydrolase [Solirubrobacteraceae bacterium]